MFLLSEGAEGTGRVGDESSRGGGWVQMFFFTGLSTDDSRIEPLQVILILLLGRKQLRTNAVS
jgi:hypothetical protein